MSIFALPSEVTELRKSLKCVYVKLDTLQDEIDAIPGGGGGSASISSAANYAALPDPTLHINELYIVLNSQGTWWLPGTLGGSYYSKGLYHSDGIAWSFLGEVPYQATQAQANAEAAGDIFITPATLGGWWTQKAVPISKITNLQTTLDTKITADDALLLATAY